MNQSSTPAQQIQEKGRISALQLALLNVTFIIATADVFLPAFVAEEAQQDSWLAVIVGTATSLAIIAVFLSLGLRYPEKTIIQYACDILGKPLGKLVGFLYTFFFLFLSYAVTGELGEIFTISFNPAAPVSLYSIAIITVAAYAVKKGLEVITRINEVLLPVGMLVLFFIATVNLPHMDLKYFRPFLYNGIPPVLRGGILIQSWLIESVFVLQLIPFVKEREKIRKHVVLSIVFLSLGLQTGVMTIAVLGPLTGKMLFPALEYVRYASIGVYINNLDISIMVVWISGIFVKIALAYYLAVLALAQLFGFPSYKELVVPVGLLIISLSIVASQSIVKFVHELHYIFPFYSFSMAFILPAILLLVSVIKDKISGTSGKTQSDQS